MQQNTLQASRRPRLLSLLSLAAVVPIAAVGCLTPKQATVPDEDGGNSGSRASYGSSGSSHVDSSAGSSATKGDASASDGTAMLMRGPTPATSTANFPFPQNRQVSGCLYPSAYQNADVQTAYTKWKTNLVTSSNAGGFQRVQRTSTDGMDACRPANSTVSEGIGYGMLIAVYMGDQTLFDNFWQYEQTNAAGTSTHLMDWAPDGSGPGCTGPASDADEDMAFALVMADKQWGSSGAINYKSAAVSQVQNIWKYEIFSYSYLTAGQSKGSGNSGWADNTNVNPSYLAPAYYRAFAAIDPMTCPQGTSVSDAASKNCDRWWGVIDQSYATISDALTNGNSANGLVPGWCNDGNAGSCPATTGQPFTYQYDACRTPFRIGLDACWNANSSAQAYVGKTSSFFSGIGAPNIVDGYALNGTPMAANAGKLSAAFIGPAAVGAMNGTSYQSFIDAAYTILAADNAFAGGEYYESSWTVMSLLMLTGNFLDYTQETPTH